MARLTEIDRQQFRELTARGWQQCEAESSPRRVEANVEARERYCRWVSELSRICKVRKPIRFEGEHWKL